MECSTCGGSCEWQGHITNLTHVKCLGCGAVNSQLPEDEDDDENPKE